MDDDITELAGRQYGVLTRTQARAAGLSRAAITHRLDRGTWIRVNQRVYRIAGAPTTQHMTVMATVLSAGPDALATGSTALALHRIRDFELLPARVVVPRRPPPTALPGVIETFRLPVGHRTVVDGIPAATVARALFDHAATVRPLLAARAIDASLAARKAAVPEILDVIDELGEHGRHGTVAMRAAMAERSTGHLAPASMLEVRFLDIVRRAGIPEPACQVDVGGRDAWIGRVDFLWRSERLIVETDGAEFHDSVSDRQRDEQRDRKLEAAGWTILRFSWLDVTRRPTSVLSTLRHALAFAA